MMEDTLTQISRRLKLLDQDMERTRRAQQADVIIQSAGTALPTLVVPQAGGTAALTSDLVGLSGPSGGTAGFAAFWSGGTAIIPRPLQLTGTATLTLHLLLAGTITFARPGTALVASGGSILAGINAMQLGGTTALGDYTLLVENGLHIINRAPTGHTLLIESTSSAVNPVIACANDAGILSLFYTARSGGANAGQTVLQNVSGSAIVISPPASGPVYVGRITSDLTSPAAGDLDVNARVNTASAYYKSGVQVLGARKTGWAAATGTATRTTFATGSVTLPQLAERVKALIDDLLSHGAIGA